jgi:hypothetical protein
MDQAIDAVTHDILFGRTSHAEVRAVLSSLSRACPAFGRHSAVATNWWFHLVYAAIELRGHSLSLSPGEWGEAFAFKKTKALIVDIFGEPVTGMESALSKLPSNPMRHGTYGKLKACLLLPEAQKHIQHATWLDADMLEIILSLPPEAISAKVIKCCNRHLAAETVRYCVDALKLVLDNEKQESAWQALRELTDFDCLYSWFYERLAAAPFPPPPWAGSNTLKPVSDGAELVRVSQEFANCLRSFVLEIISGQTCTYVWQGNIPAVVALRRDPFFGWVVGSMRGIGNSDLPHALEAEIAEQFSAAGFRREPLPMNALMQF